ncbi:M56 family metallopeptidase [Dethiobacter alkaliphilus]|uniref:M56 family metallopeptidase n=1 Tax=Dethiobacter alkaliphilus TaxID=427926 RepID=UPI0022261314|nr:M56 family metallopeptidase [Dethiobacter alkaliphilus]MCW3491399.1 M56 family metallopeptidase [Dethiobacter alkaliphilus]
MPTSLHTFFVYVFFGYFFIFPLVYLCLKVFEITHPKQRMSMYMVALMVPFASFFLYHTVLTTQCRTGYYPTGPLWQLFDLFCRAGDMAIRFLGPILVLLIVLGLLKAAGSTLYLGRLHASALNPSAEQSLRVDAIIKKYCDRWQMSVPKVIFTGRKGFVAFAGGLFRPVVVVSLPLLEQLSATEIEGVLLHELIHIRRGDTLSGWLFHLARDLMFFSPFSTILLDRYLLERERLCDQEAVAVMGRTKTYAATLLKSWRIVVEQKDVSPGVAAGFVGKKQHMEERIHSLLAADVVENKLPQVLFITLMFSVTTFTVLYLGYIC